MPDVESLGLTGEPEIMPVLRRTESAGRCELKIGNSNSQAIDIVISIDAPEGNFVDFADRMVDSQPNARRFLFDGLEAIEFGGRVGDGPNDVAHNIQVLTSGGLAVAVIGWRDHSDPVYVRELASIVLRRLDSVS